MGIHRNVTRENEIEFFEQFEGVVFGVLKRLTIHPLHPNYDDYAQIGRLKLVEAYETYPKNPWLNENRGRFIGFAFTKIRWGIIDAIRKQSLLQEREQVWDESFDHTLADYNGEMAETVLEKEWWQTILEPLTACEKRLIIDLCFLHLTITAIAKKEKVSRKTIYQRRKRIQEKLQPIIYREKGK